MSGKPNGEVPGPSSGSSVQRLPSWKAPRDLTLASLSNNLKASVNPTASKKTFVPNLNVQRKKNAEPVPVTKIKREVINAKQEKKFGGKKKDARATIQTTSVFSDGIAASEKKKSGISYRDGVGESKANLPPPKLNLERNKLVDKSVDEKTLQTLLRDDFINDDFDEQYPDNKADIKDKKAPIQLPLKVKEEPKSEEDKKLATSSGKLSHLLAEADVLGQSTESFNKFLFFQFPDSIAVSCTTPENKETASYSMKDISSGRLGTIQIMKSGKVRLVQGDKTYILSQSTGTSFHQDVVSCQTNAETKTGTLASLGPVMSRFVVAPDWDSL